jgi:anti-anti-sigma factor
VSVAETRVFRLRKEDAEPDSQPFRRPGGLPICAGRVTFPHADMLRIAVQNERHVRVAVLDLAQVSVVDAAGLGMLVSLWKWSRTRGTRLKFMNLAPNIEEVLALTKLSSIFEICSVRDMLELLCRAFHQADGLDQRQTSKVLTRIPVIAHPIEAATEAMVS